ncbi:MAG: hypothetical protein IJO32_06110 [Bacilli bacterium]|nr:hypothetical protein [Bacilli bacterium]
MIEFIIINQIPFKEIIISEIEKGMNDFNKIYNKDYKIKTFNNYNQSFINEINKKSSNKKIYILNMKYNKTKNIYLTLRKICNNKKARIIITTKDELYLFDNLFKYIDKILSETNTLKLRKGIYEIIKNLNMYNSTLSKLSIKLNDILYTVNIDDIISISKNIGNNLLTVKTEHLTLNTQLDYEYLKDNLPNNFKNIENIKIVNTEYTNNTLNNNLIVVKNHTRKSYKENYKIDQVRKYINREITINDIKTMGIPYSTFRNWLKIYGNNKNLNIKIEIEIDNK